MTDTTAQISAKGCNSTGITEDLAVALHNQLGKKVMAVVELVSESRSEKRDGKEKVTLSILTIEPAPNTDTEDHLRNLARSFHYERKLADGQLQIQTGQDLEPKVVDVLAAGRAHEPHDYVDTPEEICDACGRPAGAGIHSVSEDPTDDPGESNGLSDLYDEAETDDQDDEPLLGMDGEELSDEAPDTQPPTPSGQRTNPFEVVTT